MQNTPQPLIHVTWLKVNGQLSQIDVFSLSLTSSTIFQLSIFFEMTKRTADGRVKRERGFESAPEYLVETWTANSKHTCEDLKTF